MRYVIYEVNLGKANAAGTSGWPTSIFVGGEIL